MSEDQLLAKCHQWAWNSFPDTRYLFWHIANERKQSKVQGAIMKAKGVVSGVPDYVVNWNGKTYYIEFKTDKGIQSENQKTVQKKLEEQNINYYIIRSFDDFCELVKRIIN